MMMNEDEDLNFDVYDIYELSSFQCNIFVRWKNVSDFLIYMN